MAAGARRWRRYDWLIRLGVTPSIGDRVRDAIDAAIGEAEARSPGRVTVLDAGCGHKSPLRSFRPRIGRLVGIDIHEPDEPLPYLDDFAIVDLCRTDGWPAGCAEGFDVVVSNFTLEHLGDPGTALRNVHDWLRPGGTLILTTVNRRHPFVAAYLDLPDRVRRILQPVLKPSHADAHPLVGRCNDPVTIAGALEAGGFDDIRMETVGNLARAWGRHLPTFALGLLGDVLARGRPGARSTILAVAHRPMPAIGPA